MVKKSQHDTDSGGLQGNVCKIVSAGETSQTVRLKRPTCFPSPSFTYFHDRAGSKNPLTPSDKLPAGIDDVNEVAGDRVSLNARYGPSIHQGIPVPGAANRSFPHAAAKTRARHVESEVVPGF